MPKKIEYLFLLIFIISLGVGIYIFVDSRRVEIPQHVLDNWRLQETTTTIPPETTAPPEVTITYTEPETTMPPEDLPPPRELLPRIVQLREHYNNPDIVGFIYIPNTNISYPVVQAECNDFYLYFNLHWQHSNHGSIFLDYINDLHSLADDNTIIYGHNMRDGSKFHNIRHFQNEAYFRARPYIFLDTAYEETVWEIFSFIRTHINFDYLTPNFGTRAAYLEFQRELQRRSHHTTDIVLYPTDQILILSTCVSVLADVNYRYILVARLVRP